MMHHLNIEDHYNRCSLKINNNKMIELKYDCIKLLKKKFLLKAFQTVNELDKLSISDDDLSDDFNLKINFIS
jgi:hypothetical protein